MKFREEQQSSIKHEIFLQMQHFLATKCTSAKMNKNSQENKSGHLNVKKSDFKPRVDKHTCQYCGYTSNFQAHVNDHVNSQHEMRKWFKCMICKYVSLHNRKMKLHLTHHHKLKVVRGEINKLIVKDPNEILKYKKDMIKKRSLETNIRKKTEFIPTEKDDCKSKKDSKICQYCDYRSNLRGNLDRHVNVNHEMNRWYQCNHCPHVTLLKDDLKHHILVVHNQKVSISTIHDLVIKDQEKIDHLRRDKIRKKKFKDEFFKMTPEQLSKASKFKPINNADFKPRLYPLVCQYCGYSSKSRCSIDHHVNSNHELATWFKCDECDYATLLGSSLRKHLKNRHLRRNVDEGKIKKFLVKDQKEIDELKKKWTGKKQAQKRDNEKFSKLSQNQITKGSTVSTNEKDKICSARDIKIEKTLLEKDDNEMEHDYLLEKKDSDEYNKDALDELDEEWLTGPSW